jgi:hypothetical protein
VAGVERLGGAVLGLAGVVPPVAAEGGEHACLRAALGAVGLKRVRVRRKEIVKAQFGRRQDDIEDAGRIASQESQALKHPFRVQFSDPGQPVRIAWPAADRRGLGGRRDVPVVGGPGCHGHSSSVQVRSRAISTLRTPRRPAWH